MYSHTGRPSIPPEQILRALLLQIFSSIRSERMLVEQLEYNLLFRCFAGLSMDDKVWDHSVFSKNRDRLIKHDVATRFFETIRHQAERADLLSDEHFTVDGTPKLTSRVRSGKTRPINQPLTRRPDCSKKGKVKKPNSASWDIR